MPLANLKAAASLGIGSALMLSTTGWRSTAIVFIAADSDFYHKDNRAGRSYFLKPRRTRRTNHRAREALDRIHRINKIDSETFCSFCPKNFVTSVFSVVNGADGISDIEGKAATGSGERGGSRASFKSVGRLASSH